MRASIPSSLLTLLLPSLVAATPARSQCLHLKAQDMAAAVQCGDKGSLKQCFGSAPELVYQDTVENCLVAAGCSPSESVGEATWLLKYCDGEPDELKRRQPTPAAVPAQGVAQRQATTAAAAAGTTVAGTTSIVCSTATTISVEVCDSTDKDRCSTVATTTSVCAAQNFCMTDAAGNNLCMVRQDGLTTSGAIISIFLAVVLAGTLTSIVFLCCRDKRAQKKVRARAEAAAIAKANAISRPETRSVSQNRPPTAAAAGGANPFAG